ncbi:MAG: hypothetical protein ABMA25_02325 [Ilumatobacteraceae bacterium]
MKPSPKVWMPTTALAAILIGVSTVLLASLYGDAKSVTDRAVVLQAAFAALSLVLTVVLVAVTSWYAVLTRGILRQAGPLVSAHLNVGWLPRSAATTGRADGVLTAPLESLLTGPLDPRLPLPSLAVTLRNAGNSPTNVMSVKIETDGGATWHPLSFVVGQSCPFRLEPHMSEVRCIDLPDVLAGIDAQAKVLNVNTTALRTVVELGSGESVRSDWQSFTRTPSDFGKGQG